MRIRTTRGDFDADFLIASTGFRIDWPVRPELAALAPHVRSWRDRFTPPAGAEDEELADSPDLGRFFEFQEKSPGTCPGLARIHCFCHPATLSHGTVSGDIPAITEGAKRLAQGLVNLFYNEDIDYHFARVQAFSEPEVFGDEWVPAQWPGKRE